MEGGLSDTLLFRFATALAIGLLVGIERGWRERSEPAGSRTAGVRTYALSAFIGAVTVEVTRVLATPWPFCFALASFVAVFAWFKLRENEHDQQFSVTGVLAAFAVFALGALAVVGNPTAAAAGGVAITGLLASREGLHGLLVRLTWSELRSALLLLTMTVIVLPVLPDKAVYLGASINPKEIWLLMILTAAVSYGGYIAVKIAGPSSGVLLGGLAGAIVSSTAVTIAFARRSVETKSASLFAAGALLAGMISILRVTTIALVVSPQILLAIVGPVLAGAAIFGLCGFALLYFGDRQANGAVSLGNPFDLLPLLLFAAAYTGVSLLGGWLSRNFGETSALFTSTISALFDVDVAVLSTIRLYNESLVTATAAGQAILIALAANAVSRSACAVAAGSIKFSAIHVLGTMTAIAAGAITWLFR